MSTYVLIEQSVKPGQMASLRDIIRRSLPALLDFPGNEGVRLFEDPKHADRLVLLMRWANADDFDKYQDWRRDTGAAAHVHERLNSVVLRSLVHLDRLFDEGHDYDDRV